MSRRETPWTSKDAWYRVAGQITGIADGRLRLGPFAHFVVSFAALAVVYVLALYADALWLCALTGTFLVVLYVLFCVSFTRTWRRDRALRRRAATLRALRGGEL